MDGKSETVLAVAKKDFYIVVKARQSNGTKNSIQE